MRLLCRVRVLMIIAFVLSAPIGISGCNYGANAVSHTQNNVNSNAVVIADITTVPIGDVITNNEHVSLSVINNTSAVVTLKSIQIHNSSNSVSQDVGKQECINIEPYAKCDISLAVNDVNQKGVLLNVTYSDVSGNLHNLQRVVSFLKNMPARDGFAYDMSQINGTSRSGYVNVPFRLEKNYTNVNVMLNNKQITYTCSESGYYKGNLCTAFINKSEFGVSGINEVTFLGVQKNLTVTSKISLKFTNNTNANLITSAINSTINPANGSSPQQIFLQNNGDATATNIMINGAYLVQIQSNSCGTTLAAGAVCSFYVNVSSAAVSGQTSIVVTYNDATNTQALYANVVYIVSMASPNLTITTTGSFLNKVINTGPTLYMINIKNAGGAQLTDLLFTNVSALVTGMSSGVVGSTCISGQTLNVGDSCNLVLSYNPTATASGSIGFIPTATYLVNGSPITYSNSSLTIPYSAVSGNTFVAVGDYGMVLHSPTGAVGTWVADVANPFALTTTVANDLFINSNTYLMMLNNGGAKYSTNNGLFWKSTGASTLSASQCGITYDGTFYYTCGTASATSGGCTSGRGCIIRSNNLANAWSLLYSPAVSVLINRVFYFNNGINSAYVATFPNTTANTGLATSANGSTWAATSSGQGTAANNNFTPLVLNTVTNSLTSWNSVGFSSSKPISTFTTSWTANTTTRPGTGVKVNSALYQSSLYVLAMNDGTIYTATSPTGTYSQRNGGTSVVLNKVIYASGIGGGTYVVLGNTGVVRTATSPTGTWTTNTVPIIGQATTPNILGGYYDGTNIWATGTSALIRTSDFNTWITPNIQSIAKNGNNYLAVDNLGHIYGSSDLVNWTEQANPSGQILNDIYCVSTNLCFAVGNNGAILKSNDGSTWNSLTSSTSATLKSIYCQLNTCVAVGGTGSSGVVVVSSDFTSWSLSSSSFGATTSLNDLSYYNGMFITVGNGGALFTSTNGIDWIAGTSGVATNLLSIACGNNLGCSTVGTGGVIRYSGFGLSWIAGTSGTTNDITRVTVGSDRFVAVGKGSYIRYSTNGSTWTASTFPSNNSTTNNLYAVIPQ